ncbi:hypothetical protein [uncultured Desulfovibrio sp.]|uniref:hypothetical protein n=1 Tax=uncultured Desulfovibrio sp. TaxID=167968 RepID=UPI002673ED8D|nr:hypothetical protein [uncultured Desulfovibrio sp.]
MELNDERRIKAWIEEQVKEETGRNELQRREKMWMRSWFFSLFLLGAAAGCIITKIITH